VLVDADDVAQDALCSLLRAARRRPVPMTPEYVAKAAANHVVDASRSAYRAWARRTTDDIPADMPDLTAGPEELAVRSAMARQVASWLDQLSPTQRQVVVLRVALGMSAEETAAAVGSTPGAVRVHQHRALVRLRELAGGAR
jgi:RNA polymerase sigma-70 factor (ECF subfamily)